MTISWANSEGQTGIAENAYDFAMQHSEQPIKIQARQSGAENSADVSNYDVPGSDLTSRMQMHDNYLNYKKQPLQAPYKNLPEQEFKDLLWDTPIASSKGGGPSATDIQDILDTTDEEHKANYDSAVKALGSAGSVIGGIQPSGRIRMRKDIEGFQEYIKDIPEGVSVHDLGDGTVILRKAPSKPPEVGSLDWHQQLASFQQRLDVTPPEEAGALRKFLGSLNILPAPNKPQEEWSAKEHLGVILNQAMAGMGAGWRGAGTIAPRNFKAAFNKIEPPANANEPGGVPGISRQINPTAAEEAALMDSWNRMVKESRKADLKVIEGGKGLTTETIPQLQQAQHRGPSEPVPPKTMITPAIEQLTKYEELSSQGKTTKQIVKGTKLDLEQVREALGRDNLAIAAFNSENALTNSYFKSLERLDPALGEALKKQVSVKDLKRYTRGLPEERLKTIFEELPSHVKEAFESGEQRRMNIDASKKAKIIPKPLK